MISIASCLFVYLRSWFSALLGLKASKALFSGFMDSVFKASMLFFNSTPVGRILIRASSDMSIIDFDIPFTIAFALSAIIDITATTLVMANVTWQVLLEVPPVLVAMKICLGPQWVFSGGGCGHTHFGVMILFRLFEVVMITCIHLFVLM